MNTFECYQLFMALKMHFTSPSYDFVKYNGKLKSATPQALERHKQKFYFQKLQKMKDPKGYIIANMLRTDKLWIGDLFSSEGEACYEAWRKRRESLYYTFTQECKSVLNPDFDSNFRVRDNEHPLLLRNVINDAISLDSFLILDACVVFMHYWDRKLKDDLLWDMVSTKSRKYTPFMPSIDISKYKKFLRDEYGPTS
jgi:hypothetical protein